MEREIAENIIVKHIKSIYGFAVKHCRYIQDAEDLSQEITLRVFRALLSHNDIENTDKFIWTIAHNCLCNYYRDSKLSLIGVCVDEYADILADSSNSPADDMIMQETINKLHYEIAYLSKLRRKIVIAYYYENKKQNDIAKELDIPLGTVKWHLFEAKKDLKKGMGTMRNYSELKFNPIKFSYYGENGTSAQKNGILDGILAQNIEYCVLNEAKSVNQISDELGISPAYIESEAQRLEEYGYLTQADNKYLCNILLDMPSERTEKLCSDMYKKATKIFANELYDELMSSDIWDSPDITGGYPSSFGLSQTVEKDKNFFLWALIPYIASQSGVELIEHSISFDDAATYRPDGGRSICFASILETEQTNRIKSFYGPCQSFNQNYSLWQLDSSYSGGRINSNNTNHILYLLDSANDTNLTEEEYAYLCEQGILSTSGEVDKLFKSAFQCVFLANNEINNKLVSIGDKIKEKHWKEFEALKKPYADAILSETPKQLLKMRKYNMQFTFFGDGPFIVSCLDELVNSSRLTLPTDEQRKALHTIVIKK